MPLRMIVTEGEDCLTKKCREIVKFDARLHELLDDMKETLEKADGAGLAAPQVGVLRACAVVALEDGSFAELVNPKILSFGGEQNGLEGCLSVPGVWGKVTRPLTVTVTATDRYGKPFEMTGEGFLARALCHEIDHLSGHLFTERVTEYVDIEQLEKEAAKLEKEATQ